MPIRVPRRPGPRDRRATSRRSAGLRLVGLLPAMALVATCAQQPTGFQREAESVAASIASARSTIELVHAGQLTVPYAKAAFVELSATLEDAPDGLRSADGAPADVDRLARLAERARGVAESPCLEGACDWQGQLRTLDEARQALDATVPK